MAATASSIAPVLDTLISMQREVRSVLLRERRDRKETDLS